MIHLKNNWPTKKLGEICEERKEKNIKNLNLPVYTVSHIHGLIPYQKIFYKQVHSKDTRNYKVVKHNDFVFGLPTKDTLPLGYLSLENEILVSPAYTVFSIKQKNLLYPRFLFYLFKTEKYKWRIIEIAKAQSATRHGLPLKFTHLENLEIPLPSLPIQQKIVKVLDTIQSAVEIQEKIIEKTKELKKSLMNLLFHYGLAGLRVKELMSSRVGELTSSEIEKLELKLKKTEIGEIPEHWEVVRLGEVAIKMKAGGTPNTSEKKYWNGEISFALIEDLVNAGKFLTKTNASITKLGLDNSSSWIVPKDSIILSLYATVGKPVINKIPVAITQNMIGIIPNREKIESEFLYYALENTQINLWKYSDLSVHKHITTSEAQKIPIPLPPLPEQQEIAEILQTIDQKIEIEKRKKELYEELFKTMLNKIMSQEIDVDLLDY